MVRLLIGTAAGVICLDQRTATPEGALPSTRFLARGADGAYALDSDNALWRRDAAGDWTCINPRCIEQEVWAFACDSRPPGRLYLGISPAMLYRSDDGGASWMECESIRRIPGYDTWTFPPPPHIPHVRSIAPDPEVVGGLFIGVEEGGVFRSPDGGDTWQSLNDGLYWDVHTVTPVPGARRLYATTGGGFYRSEDSGATWRHHETGLDRGYTVAFAVSPAAPDVVYTAAAATPPPGWRNGANAGLYRSADGGERWQHLEGGLPAQFDRMVGALVAEGDGQAYACAGSTVFGSEDGGEHWSALVEGLPAVQALITL